MKNMEKPTRDIMLKYLQYLFDNKYFNEEYGRSVLDNYSTFGNILVINVRLYKHGENNNFDGVAIYPSHEEFLEFEKGVLRNEKIDKLLNVRNN